MTTLDAPGSMWTGDGTHFRVFSRPAAAVELCLFDGHWLQHLEWPGRDLQVDWLGPDAQPLTEEDWQSPRSHLALLGALDGSEALLALNASDQPVSYRLPGRADQPWQEAVRTDREEGSTEPDTVTCLFEVPGRTVSLLVRQRDEGEA